MELKKLAELLGGNYWEKGNLKRIYLDSGWNTKKMSTKTFVWQDEYGNFKVSCRIECSSQTWQWIKSQQDEIVESTYNEINEVIRLEAIELINYELIEDKLDVKVIVRENENEVTYNSDEDFYKEYGAYPYNHFQGDFLKDYEEMIAKSRSEVKITEDVQTTENHKKSESNEVKSISNETYGVGSTVNHSKFQKGVVVSETDTKIEIDFKGEIGVKSLLKQFVKLEKC